VIYAIENVESLSLHADQTTGDLSLVPMLDLSAESHPPTYPRRRSLRRHASRPGQRLAQNLQRRILYITESQAMSQSLGLVLMAKSSRVSTYTQKTWLRSRRSEWRANAMA
jgi:hypothetical protein